MSNANGVISAPVTDRDIRQVLGIGSNDLDAWCKSANINKWAKYKPVRLNSVTTTSQFDKTNNVWKSDANWWKSDGMCGFSTEVSSEFGTPTSSGSWSYKLINGQLGWTYNKPGGSATSPYSYYRITDFVGYNHGAVQPFGGVATTTVYVNNQNQAQIDWEVLTVGNDNLKLSDFAVQLSGTTYQFSDMYLGIILWSGSTYHMYTSSTKFSDGNSLSITLSNISSGMLGTWNMLPFFTKNQTNASGTFDANGVFVSMGITSPISITLTTNGSNYFDTPFGEWNQAGTSVSYECDIINDTSNTKNYTSIRISIRGGSPTGQELGYTTLTNVSVGAHSTSTRTGTISATKSGYASYWIVISDLTSGSTISSANNQVEDYGGM